MVKVDATTDSAKAPASAPAKGDEFYLVNLSDFAKMYRRPTNGAGISLPTLREIIDANEAFPVEARGTNGVAWQIDARKAKAWLDEYFEKETEADRRDRERKQQLTFELFGDSLDPELDDLTADERLKQARARQEELRLAEQQGRLVRRDDVRRIADDAFSVLRKELQPIAADLAKRLGLDRGEKLAIENRIRQALDKCADKLGGFADADDRAA